MVRRLVEQQEGGLLQQQLRERDAHLPAAGKRVGGPLEVGGREAEALEDRGGLELDAVAVAEAELVLQIAVAREHRVVLRFGDARIAEAPLEAVHLGLDCQERRERARRLLEHRVAGVREAVLRQVADGERRGREDGARVGLVEARHHPEEGGLAGAVGAAEAHALTVGDLPGDVVEEGAVAEGLGEGLELDHPFIRRAPSRRRPAPAAPGTAW